MAVGKALLFLGSAAAGLLIAGQWPDIQRYVKIRQLSTDDGHPGNVPAGGRIAYPQQGHGDADGTGDFDSARRGGPAG
jgi:hypothetical protein